MLDFFKSTGPSAIEEVEKILVQMVRDSRAVYDAATGAVFGGGKSKETKREVKTTDRGINAAQRDVRRALMLHSSVTGAVDLPLVLTYMSVVKDAERIGDYAKNLYDLARYGADFEAYPNREELERHHEVVGALIDQAADVFEARDADAARALIARGDEILDACDKNVRAAYESEGPASDAVAKALYYRYLKRITAHVMNLMTALVLPIDQLDYYDEAVDDRD
jgi:phosphate uptake regulator